MGANETSDKGVKRRTVLRGLATGFAGAVAAPRVSALATGESHAPGVQAASPEGAAAPRLFNVHDRELLDDLCERIVPGSVAAGVPDLVDQVAAVETAETQRAILASVRAFEAEARARHATSWVALDEMDRHGILESAASGKPSALHEQFSYLRDVVAQTYFATEPGMRRLGWTPRNAWRELPRCEHSGDEHR